MTTTTMKTAASVKRLFATKQTMKLLFNEDSKISIMSPKVNFLGDEWYFSVEKHTIHINKNHLRVYLFRSSSSTLPSDIIYEIRFVGANNCCLSQKGSISNNADSLKYFVAKMGVSEFLKTASFFDAKGNMMVELDISVEKETAEPCGGSWLFFSDKSPFPTDCLILVDNKKIHVDKKFLSIHSAVFRAMFESGFKEKNQAEIELEDVDYNEFIELLSVIYPVGHLISASNVECLLKLADRFEMLDVLSRCDQFLWSDPHIGILKKLLMAQEYNRVDFREYCAGQFHLLDEIRKLENEHEYSLLDDRSMALMLKSLLRPIGK